MNSNTTIDTLTEFFGEPIHAYTRVQAIEEGMLIDVSTTAREAGIVWPVAVTNAVWSDAIAWGDADDKRKRGRACWQSEIGRLWDVVWMASHAIRAGPHRGDDGSRNILFQVLRIPRDGRGARPTLTTLSLHVGPGDDCRPVITIMLPSES